MTTLTTVIPTRGFAPLVNACLDLLAAATVHAAARHPLAARVVVVDNATPHPLELAWAGAQPLLVLRFDVHHGFAACCNCAVAEAPADVVLLLNNDVLLHRDALAAMLDVMAAEPHVGICGARLVFPDGRLQHAGVRFDAEHGPYHEGRGRDAGAVSRESAPLQAVTGACLLARGTLWRDLDGLDERYPFGLEDIDLCLRAGQAGWHVRCAQDVDSVHFESMTPGRVELDGPSRRLFMQRWQRRYTVDGRFRG